MTAQERELLFASRLADEILTLWDHATQVIQGAATLSAHVAREKTGAKSPPLNSALEQAASFLQLLEALARVMSSSSAASYRSTIAALQLSIDGLQTSSVEQKTSG